MTPPFSPGDKLVAYLRDSGHEEQELSIQQQKNHLQNWAQQHGYTITKIYTDSSTGTTTAGRDQFHAMMQHLRAKDCPETGLIVWKWNRFARNIDDAQFYRADLRRRGITLDSLNEDIPPGSQGRFFEAAIDWMNQRYIEDLSTDTKRGLKELVENYGCVPGTPPCGFKRQRVVISTRRDGEPHVAHKWVPDPNLVPLVQKAWRMRAGGATYRQIARTTQLYKTKNSYPTFFRNKLYIGILEYGDLVIENYCDPIIDQQTWDAVQAINRKNKQRHKQRQTAAHKRKGHAYALSGIAYCARCGSALTGRYTTAKGKRYYYYECTRHHNRRDCGLPAIPKETLEQTILDQLTAYLSDPPGIQALTQAQRRQQQHGHEQLTAERNAYAQKQAQTTRKINNITAAIAQSGHSGSLLEKLTQLERTKAQIQAQIDQIDQQRQRPPSYSIKEIENLTGAIKKALSEATNAERKQIYHGLIEKITLDRQGDKLTGHIHIYLPPKVCKYGTCPGRSPNRSYKLSLILQ
jgi:DNA invertase Pin-like site-specific DNA recombinase